MDTNRLDPIFDSTNDSPSSRLSNWIAAMRAHSFRYSLTLVAGIVLSATLGIATGSPLVLVPVTTGLLIAGFAMHTRQALENTSIKSQLSNAEQRIVSEASASRMLGGIKILRSNDSMSQDARLASAARMATEYPAAVVFNLNDAQGVLAPSNWSYEGELSHVRDQFEPIDGTDPGAAAARQGAAIVVSSSDPHSPDVPEWAELSGFTQGIVTPIAKGLDTIGVVYVLSKSLELPTLNEIEQLELIVSFSSSGASETIGVGSPSQSQPFRVVEKPSSVGSTPTGTAIRMSGFALNPESERMEMDGALISLSPTEFMLMHTLASAPEQPVSSGELMDRCWSKDSRPADNAVDVAIFRLRKKLNKTASGKGLIKTVRGSGYMFVPPAVDHASPVVAD